MCGVRCVVCGVRCAVCGVWRVVCGVWCVVCGVWRVDGAGLGLELAFGVTVLVHARHWVQRSGEGARV